MAIIGLAALAATAATIERRQAFSLGVIPQSPFVGLRPGETLCQGPIDVSEDFERLTVTLTTFKQRGPSLLVRVRDVDSHAIVARGRLAGGYPDDLEHEIQTGRVRSGSRIDVCFTNRGRRTVAAYGSGNSAHAASTATVDGSKRGYDVTMRFLYDEPRSLLRLAPAMIDRATLFAPGWARAMLWVLVGLVAIGVPGLLTYALARATDPRPPQDASEG